MTTIKKSFIGVRMFTQLIRKNSFSLYRKKIMSCFMNDVLGDKKWPFCFTFEHL